MNRPYNRTHFKEGFRKIVKLVFLELPDSLSRQARIPLPQAVRLPFDKAQGNWRG